MQMTVRFGNPFLIFLYSASLLAIGDAVGIFWRTEPVAAFSMVLLSASLMVVHDTFMTLLWAWAAARWAQAVREGKPKDR